MAQRGACKYDHCQGYMTILVVNHGIIKCISILTAVIHPMIKFGGDILRNAFRQEVKRTLAIRYQLSTLSGLDLDPVHHLSHAVLQAKVTYCRLEGNQWIPNALRWIQSGGYHKDLQCCPLQIE